MGALNVQPQNDSLPGHNDLKSRCVAEISLRRLGVVVSTVAHGTAGRSDRQTAAVELVSGSVPELGGLVDQLVESRKDVICELDLCNRSLAHGRIANSKTCIDGREMKCEHSSAQIRSVTAVSRVQAHLQYPARKEEC